MNRLNQSAAFSFEPARLRVIGGNGGAAVTRAEWQQRALEKGEDRFRGMKLVERREAVEETGNVQMLPVEPVRYSNGSSSYEQARRIVEQIHRELAERAERERKQAMEAKLGILAASETPEKAGVLAAPGKSGKTGVLAGWRERMRRFAGVGELVAVQS